MNKFYDANENTSLWNDISMFSAWKGAVTRPGSKTFETIVSAENANAFRGLLWYYIAIVLGMMCSLILYHVLGFPTLGNFLELFIGNPSFEPIYEFQSYADLFRTLMLVPFAGIVPVLIYAAGIFVANLISNFFRGRESFSKYLFVDSAASAPLFVLRSILMPIPHIGLVLFLLVNLYRAILKVRILREVKKVSWFVAIAIIFIPVILISIAVPVLIFALIQIMLSQAIPINM